MTNKDIEMTTCGLQKSLIEVGVPLEKVEEELKKQIAVFARVSNAWKEGINNGK